MKGLVLSLAVALACAAGCKSKDKGGSGEAPAEPTSKAPPTERASEPVDVTPLAGDEVRAVVDAWLEAQNGGNFDRYRELYAARFTGVKRIGPRTFRYDRDGWLGDRERMFEKKMSVSADDVSISATSQSAVVQLTQTWASGTFKDVGPKRLVVVREADGLAIAREEMLASTVVGAAGAAEPPPREAFGFVLNEGDASYFVLRAGAEDAWGAGDPALVSRSSPALATRPAKLDALPEELRGWKGKRVQLFPPGAPACATTIQELVVLTGYEPHFSALEHWESASDAEVARDIWQGGDAARFLVGRAAERCPGAIWGRLDDKTVVPRLQELRDDTDDLEAAALERFRGLKGYALVAEDFEGDGPWDRHDGAEPAVAVFRDRKVKRDFVAVAAIAGPGCGDFYGEFWALFQVVVRDGKPDLVLLTDERNPGDLFFPREVADIDADGDVELISATALVKLVGTTYRIAESVAYPTYDCPC